VEHVQSVMMKWLRRILPVLLGAAGGYAYYHFIGCASGTCPLTSNPYITTAYGSIIGALLIPRSMNREKEQR
jgi:phage shock protein E